MTDHSGKKCTDCLKFILPPGVNEGICNDDRVVKHCRDKNSPACSLICPVHQPEPEEGENWHELEEEEAARESTEPAKTCGDCKRFTLSTFSKVVGVCKNRFPNESSVRPKTAFACKEFFDKSEEEEEEISSGSKEGDTLNELLRMLGAMVMTHGLLSGGKRGIEIFENEEELQKLLKRGLDILDKFAKGKTT